MAPNRRRALIAPACLAALAIGSAATAQLIDIEIPVDPFGPLGGSETVATQAAIPGSPQRVVGLSFEGTVSGISGNDSWASDLRLVLTGPGGAVYEVGGADNLVNPWSFQGSRSTEDGTYSDTQLGTFEYAQLGGTWTLEFSNDFGQSPETMSWSDVVVTLHAVDSFCRVDLNGDDAVNVLDMLSLLGAWGDCQDCTQDLNDDGTVNVLDLLEVLGAWGACPDPPVPTGACCFEKGDCQSLTETECTSTGGEYQGDFLMCADVDCTPKKPGLCDGICGEVHISGCSCEPDCFDFGICCEDICEDCPDLPDCVAQSSCAGNCGGAAPSGCFCDESCVFNGDCCADICDECPKLSHCNEDGTCKGACGGISPDGCWCDETCDAFGDCCPDRCDVCPDLASCTDCGAVTCTNNENEPCGQSSNNGCSSDPPAYGTIGCGPGEGRCGTLHATGGQRDVDWFTYENNTSTDVSLLVVAEEPVEVFITNAACGGELDVLAEGTGCSVNLTTCLTAGTYRVVVQPTVFSGLPCPGFKYSAVLNCDPVANCPGEPDADYAYDTGSSNATLSNFFNGGVLVWMNRYDAIGGADVIANMEVMFGTPESPGTAGVFGGEPFGAAIYADTGSGPGKLLWSTSSLTVDSAAIDSDEPQIVSVPDVAVNGGFFIATWVWTGSNSSPAPRDSTVPPSISNGNSWFAGIPSGDFEDFDPAEITSIAVPPTDINQAGLPGVFVIRASSAK